MHKVCVNFKSKLNLISRNILKEKKREHLLQLGCSSHTILHGEKKITTGCESCMCIGWSFNKPPLP